MPLPPPEVAVSEPVVTVASAEAPPAVTLAWTPRGAAVSVAPPAGFKVAPDAPWSLTLGSEEARVALDGAGAALSSPRPVPALTGALTGRLEVGLCTLDGATCRPTEWSLDGVAAATRRGAVALTVAPPAAVRASPFGPAASGAPLDAALTRAQASGRPVLIDFSAAWCPPCNQLGAELLHAEPPDPALAGFEVAVLDADHPSSFPAKDRYDVGGYPTLLVVAPDGAERTRLVGYPGLEATRAWLASAGTSTDAADLAAGPDAATPARAAALAWWLAGAGREDEAGPWLARAESGGADGPERHLAALALRSDPAELRWVLDHAPDRAGETLALAAGLAEAEPMLVRELCDRLADSATGTQQADLLELRAAATPPGPERLALLRGAAAVLVALRTGDPARDKPHVTWLAQLLERSEQPDAAVALLQDASLAWPSEPTYDLALAPLLVRLGRAEEALAVADRAVQRAWGDNHLRAVAARAKVLRALGRVDEARAAAAAELAAAPAPPPGTNPRTDRYRAALQALADGP